MKNINIGFLMFIFLLVSSGCTDSDELPSRNYELVWEDDFIGEVGESPDATKWAAETVDIIGNGWGNNEQQSYTDRPDNVSLDGGGNLVITARQENFNNRNYTSARIKTEGIFEQAYGRFEARIQLPLGQGIWPAFWLLGNNCGTEIWPQCGEIDVMEYRGQEPTLIHGSVHGPGYSAGNAVTKSFTLQNGRFDVGFHVFAVEWGEDYIDYFVDDTFYQRITPDDVSGEWVYDHPFYIILNVAVGGSFVGSPNNETTFPQRMLVDWVKVYKEAN